MFSHFGTIRVCVTDRRTDRQRDGCSIILQALLLTLTLKHYTTVKTAKLTSFIKMPAILCGHNRVTAVFR